MLKRRMFRSLMVVSSFLLSFNLNAEALQDYSAAWSLPLNTQAPKISALDSKGAQRNFENLRMDQGLLIFFNRSADW